MYKQGEKAVQEPVLRLGYGSSGEHSVQRPPEGSHRRPKQSHADHGVAPVVKVRLQGGFGGRPMLCQRLIRQPFQSQRRPAKYVATVCCVTHIYNAKVKYFFNNSQETLH